MIRLYAGTILSTLFIVVAVIMAYDINTLQRALPEIEHARRAQLELWKVTTLFAGGVLAALTAVVFFGIRTPEK